MREVVETFNVYTYRSAPKEIQDKIREYIVTNWDLYEHIMEERVHTLKEVASLLNAELDYSLSCVPNRGEFIKMTPKYDSLNFSSLWEAIDIEKECPLTGVCYDHDLIDHLSKYNLNTNTLNNAFKEFIESIHDEYKVMCESEYIADMCESNEYEFYGNGKLYS